MQVTAAKNANNQELKHGKNERACHTHSGLFYETLGSDFFRSNFYQNLEGGPRGETHKIGGKKLSHLAKGKISQACAKVMKDEQMTPRQQTQNKWVASKQQGCLFIPNFLLQMMLIL